MTFFARVIEVITRTGGEVFDVVKVEAAHGADAVSLIAEAANVSPILIYLISEDEAREWAALQIPIKEVPLT
jgi:ribosomal protein S28E/S33